MFDRVRGAVAWAQRRGNVERSPQATMVREAERLAAMDERANRAFLDRLERSIRIADERGDHDLAGRGRDAYDELADEPAGREFDRQRDERRSGRQTRFDGRGDLSEPTLDTAGQKYANNEN